MVNYNVQDKSVVTWLMFLYRGLLCNIEQDHLKMWAGRLRKQSPGTKELIHNEYFKKSFINKMLDTGCENLKTRFRYHRCFLRCIVDLEQFKI